MMLRTLHLQARRCYYSWKDENNKSRQNDANTYLPRSGFQYFPKSSSRCASLVVDEVNNATEEAFNPAYITTSHQTTRSEMHTKAQQKDIKYSMSRTKKTMRRRKLPTFTETPKRNPPHAPPILRHGNAHQRFVLLHFFLRDIPSLQEARPSFRAPAAPKKHDAPSN